MINIYLARPDWFFGVDATLEAFAFVISFLIAFASYKLYSVTHERNYKDFLASFALLSASFLSRSVADAILSHKFVRLPDNIIAVLFFGVYISNIFLALAAYLLLIASTYKISDKRLIVLMFLLLVPSLLLSGSYFLSFYVLSAILLVFISWVYYQNYRKVSSTSSLLVFVSFLLLTLAQPQFIFDALTENWYVSAHLTQALGYLTLLAALVKILRK